MNTVCVYLPRVALYNFVSFSANLNISYTFFVIHSYNQYSLLHIKFYRCHLFKNSLMICLVKKMPIDKNSLFDIVKQIKFPMNSIFIFCFEQ